MATGALDTNGVWLYGEDDSEATFSALLNKLGTSIGSTLTGRVVQTVTGFTTTLVTNSTNSYIDTGLTATITPKFANSRIVILVSQQGLHKSSANAENGVNIRLNRGSTVIQDFGKVLLYTASVVAGYGSTSTIFSELSGSTTARTYKTQFANYTNASLVSVQGFGSARSEIILMEITA